MKHLGDITKISGAAVPAVDVVIGGSPCQDLSIAGRRAGLAGERSGLFMEQVRIAREMREEDVKRGHAGLFLRPRFMVWENVTGVFSSNGGNDFRAVLEETIRIAEPDAPDIPLPPKGRWPMADCWMGDGWSVAYRVFDSQFWGVPQRRRRIALVADFGGHAAPEILFIRKGVCGDLAEGGPPRKSTAAGTGSGIEGTSLTNRGLFCEHITETLRVESHGAIPITWCLQGNAIDLDAKMNGLGIGQEPMFTLNTVDRHAVCQAMPFDTTQITSPINRSNPKSRVTDYTAIAMATGQGGTEIMTDKSPTLACNREQPIVMGLDCRNGKENGDLCGTLQAKSNGGYSLNSMHPVRIGGFLRRITPLECERLQGYPDGWTDIGPWTDSKGNLHKKSSDSARYKALGNSIALPPWAWVLKRLCACYERPATMASLFDGIGGFPLLWERLNGPGSCLWASEIEEFPIAVTRRRLGDCR